MGALTTTRERAIAHAPKGATTTPTRPEAATATAPATASAPAVAQDRAVAVPAVRMSPFGGWHALLFAAYPILFLWSQNAGEVAARDVGDALGYALLVVILATAGFAWVFQDRRRAALLVSPAILGFLLYGHIAKLNVPTQVINGAWLAIMVIALVAAFRLAPRWLARLDLGLTRIAAILVAISLVSIVPLQVEAALTPDPILAGGRALPTATTAPKRDVYWLVFDRYGSDRAFQTQFGVANPLTPWLRDHGFEVLEDSHANYVGTALSMSTTLNMTPLDELTTNVPTTSKSYQPVYNALQSSLVVRQFQALGYDYLHLGSWWNPTRTDEAADRNYNADGVSDFTSAVLEMSVIPQTIREFHLEQLPPTESTKHLEHNTFALDTLGRIAREPGPKFVLAHVLLPHPPYVFDRDGRYIDPEEAATLDTADAWHRQLDYTNSRLQAFLEGLMALPPERQPIIILQADEGPWPDGYAKDQFNFDWATASEAELETKFGIMNAWRVPGGADLGLTPSQTAINTFPILFDRYFGLDYPLLPDRVSSSRGWTQPYDLTDITDRLPSLRAATEP